MKYSLWFIIFAELLLLAKYIFDSLHSLGSLWSPNGYPPTVTTCHTSQKRKKNTEIETLLPAQLVYKVNDCIHEWVGKYQYNHSNNRPFNSVFSFFYLLIVSNRTRHISTTHNQSSNSEEHAKCDESIYKMFDSLSSSSRKRGIARIFWIHKIRCIFCICSSCKTIIYICDNGFSAIKSTLCKYGIREMNTWWHSDSKKNSKRYKRRAEKWDSVSMHKKSIYPTWNREATSTSV